jgi:hypothetical protein
MVFGLKPGADENENAEKNNGTARKRNASELRSDLDQPFQHIEATAL